jgi:hypothetical protein
MKILQPLFSPKNGISKKIPISLVVERLKKHERIKDVKIIKGTLSVLTKEIKYCGRNLGGYRITYNPNKHNHHVARIKGTVRGYNHPFISGDNCCFGNQASVFNRAREDGDAHGVILMILELLDCKTATVGSNPYISVTSFLRGLKRPNDWY